MEQIEVEYKDRRDPVDLLWLWIAGLSSLSTTALQSQAEPFLVGFVIVNVVGLRYYQGTISGHEIVGLVPDELNPHDENAIKVLKMLYVQVGYIERTAAAVLSPLIDSRSVAVEGSLDFSHDWILCFVEFCFTVTVFQWMG